jgi:hypothetical protein
LIRFVTCSFSSAIFYPLGLRWAMPNANAQFTPSGLF